MSEIVGASYQKRNDALVELGCIVYAHGKSARMQSVDRWKDPFSEDCHRRLFCAAKNGRRREVNGVQEFKPKLIFGAINDCRNERSIPSPGTWVGRDA
eukprot:4566967-Pyramimonas_sp.AAC.2